MATGFTRGKIAGTVVGAGVAFYLVNRGAEFGRARWAAGEKMSDALGQFPADLLGDPLRLSDDSVNMLIALGAGVLVLLMGLYAMGAKKNTRQGRSTVRLYGQARVRSSRTPRRSAARGYS